MINNRVREMEFGLFDDEKDGEHNGFGLLEISNISAMQSDLFSET